MKRRNEVLGVSIGILGILIAVIALIVALLSWLVPFEPIGSSPLQQSPTPLASTQVIEVTVALPQESLQTLTSPTLVETNLLSPETVQPTASATPTATHIPPSITPLVLPPTPTANIAAETQQAQCQWLQNYFPQSPVEVRSRYGLPNDTTISFIHELCPFAANAFAFKANTVIELEVPPGGCIDSWAGFTVYVGDVSTPVADGNGGWRVYQGIVRAPEMTYRIMGCK